MNIDNLLMRSLYSSQLGNLPQDSNIHMTEGEFIKFQQQFITPKRTVISAANVNHNEFVERVQKMLNKDYKEFLNRPEFPDEVNVVEPKYLAIEQDQDMTDVAIVFESFNWKAQELIVLNVINIMIGQSSSFSSGGPGKGMHSRTTKNLLNSLYFIDSASCVNLNYQDTGVFGIKVQGSNENKNDLIESVIKELKELTAPITDEEVERSKNILMSLISLSLERQTDRLEELTKNLMSFNHIRINEYHNQIKKITGKDINELAKKLLKRKPGVAIIGKDVSKCMSYDKIQSLLKL